MLAIDDCDVYGPDIKRVTKLNGFVASGREIYIVKKDKTGKTLSKVFNAYDKESKILLASHWDKEFLIGYLIKKDLSCLGGQQGLF